VALFSNIAADGGGAAVAAAGAVSRGQALTLHRLLSGDFPRSRCSRLALLASRRPGAGAVPVSRCARAQRGRQGICVFVVLVASYDLLLGYTGIVSFAHTMFYGIGAYGIGLTCTAHGAGLGRGGHGTDGGPAAVAGCWRW
jgi:hypothetical protein